MSRSLKYRLGVIAFLGVTGSLVLSFQNCSQTKFETAQDASVATVTNIGDPGPTPPPQTTSCNLGSDSSGICNLSQALVGSIYIQPRPLEQSAIPYANGPYVGATQIEDYLSHPEWRAGATIDGKFVPYTIALSSIDSLNNPFDNGFVTQTGETIKVPDGSGAFTTAPNYFAIDLFGTFHLDANDADGQYQFAVIADDGAQILYKPEGQPTYTMLVDDQVPKASTNAAFIPGTQDSRMGCAVIAGQTSKITTLALKAGSRIPLEVRYYNGPLGLNFRLMYRQVPASGALDSFCETDTGGDASFKPTVDLKSPILVPDQLSDWKIIKAANLGN